MLLRMMNTGYEITNEDGEAILTISNHEGLFTFAEKDLSALPQLLERYVRSVLDLYTLMPVPNSEPDDYALSEIKRILVDSHVFLGIYTSETIADALGEYINALLIHKETRLQTSEQYSAIYSKLVDGIIKKEDYSSYVSRHYINYLGMIDGKVNYLQIEPIGFVDLLRFQDYLRKWLFWILDISAPEINALTTSQRIALFSRIFPPLLEEPIISIPKRMSFINPHTTPFYHYNLKAPGGEDVPLAAAVLEYSNDPGRVSSEALNMLQCLIQDVKNETVLGLFEEYQIENIGQLLFLEFEQMIRNGTMIKRCRHCKRYFVVSNLIVEYCDRIAEGESQPCSDIGSKRSFKKKLEEDYPLRIYNRAYKTHYARVTAKKMTRGEFNEWVIQAHGKLEEVRAGTQDVLSFEKWLKI